MTRDHSQTYAAPADMYAFARCSCKHIVYADDTPGGRCRWNYIARCDCTDHMGPADRAAQAEAGEGR